MGEAIEGFGGAGVWDVVDDYDGDTNRAVYTVQFKGVVYILCAFQRNPKAASQRRTTNSRGSDGDCTEQHRITSSG